MEKARLFHADIDEGGLHAGENPRHFAFVDIARDAHFFFSFDQKFGQLTVFDKRDAALLRRRIDVYLLFHKTL